MSSARTRGTTGSRKKITDEEVKRMAEEFARTRAFYQQQRFPKTGIPSGRAMGAQILGNCDEVKLGQEKDKLVAANEGKVTSPCAAIDTDLSCPKNYNQAKKKLTRLHPDKNTGCSKLSEEMMKKYQECCYHQVDDAAGHTSVKWNANDKDWRNPSYLTWYETPQESARRSDELDAELDAILKGFSKRDDFSDSSLERDFQDLQREGEGQTPTPSDVEGELHELDERINVADLRRQFEEEGYGKYVTQAEEEEERKRNAEIERKRKDDMEKKATKIQALQRGRTSRKKTPSAALCRMCEAPGFYDPKCDLCPEGTGKTKEFRRRTSSDESSDFSLPSDMGSSEPESMTERYPPPARKRDSSMDADFSLPSDIGSSERDSSELGSSERDSSELGSSELKSSESKSMAEGYPPPSERSFKPPLRGCESVRIKGKKNSATRSKSVKACTSKPGCKVGKVTTKNGNRRTRCITRKKGRKRGEREQYEEQNMQAATKTQALQIGRDVRQLAEKQPKMTAKSKKTETGVEAYVREINELTHPNDPVAAELRESIVSFFL